MNQCIGLCGRLFGHKFVGRYDTEETGPDPKVVSDLFSRRGITVVLDNDVDVVRQLRSYNSVYKHSVCVRCGAVVEKEKA